MENRDTSRLVQSFHQFKVHHVFSAKENGIESRTWKNQRSWMLLENVIANRTAPAIFLYAVNDQPGCVG